MKTTKRSLLASGLAVLVCIAMLAGTTFAWFTDSVVNKGNKIQSGSLSIDAYAYDLVQEGEEGGLEINGIPGVNNGEPFQFEEEGQNLKEDPSPILNETLWEPGKSSAKLLKVQNNGTLAAKIKLDFTVIDGGLQDALWFDFIQVKDGQVTGQFTKRPMSELATIAQNLELPVLKDESLQFILVYGMDEEAGNEYQDKSFSADIMIQATQYTEEEDGFGNNQYDEDAAYAASVSSLDEFQNIINSSEDSNISLSSDLTLENTTDARFAQGANTILDLNNKTITGQNGNIGLVAVNGSTVDVSNGSIAAAQGTYCTMGADSNSSIYVNNVNLSNVTSYGCSVKAFSTGYIRLNNVTSTSNMGGGVAAAGGTVDIYNSTFTQTGYYDHNSVNVAVSNFTGTANIYSGTFTSENYGLYIFSSGGTINVYGGTFKAGREVIKADLDLNSYPTAKGVINIYDGSFDGKINVSDKCTLSISGGTFQNTGLTLEQFKAYVADGHTVTEANGVYTVA